MDHSTSWRPVLARRLGGRALIAGAAAVALAGCGAASLTEETFFVGEQRCSMSPDISYDYGPLPSAYWRATALCDPARDAVLERRASAEAVATTAASPE